MKFLTTYNKISGSRLNLLNLGQQLLLMLAVLWTSSASALLKDEVAFYVEAFGEVTAEQDPQVKLAKQIFQRLYQVADKNSKRLPKLVVINNPTKAWAIALPAGHIILSKRALEIAAIKADSTLNEARLAFVLGHELAHLANDDYWHHEVESFLREDKQNQQSQQIAHFINQNRSAKQSELGADDKGYIYAAMAGYRVEQLLQATAENATFFSFWLQQTNTLASSTHPQAQERAELLRQRLQQIDSKLAFFRYGTRLSHFGRCQDALYFFKEFQKTFPGRSVLNNIGMCYLQLAKKQMSSKRKSFYWLPLQLDAETRASALTRNGMIDLDAPAQYLRSLSRADDDASGYLNDAVNVLTLAVQQDPGYNAAHINLAIAYLYQGKPHQARAALADLRTQSNRKNLVDILDAIALYEQSDSEIDLWPAAIQKLELRLKQQRDSAVTVYNLARLYSLRPRPAEAGHYWTQLLKAREELPTQILAIVCAKQAKAEQSACSTIAERAIKPSPWKWPYTKEQMPLDSATRQSLLSNWQATKFDWATANLHGLIHQSPDQRSELLEVSQFVQMQVMAFTPPAAPALAITELQSYCPYPLAKSTLETAEIWRCNDWSAYIVNQSVVELWRHAE